MLFYNLGLTYRQAGLIEEALAALERSHAINPRPIASVRRADATDRVAEMRAARDRLDGGQRDFPGSPPPAAQPARAVWHQHLARWLEERGEAHAARGHRLRAQVLEPR